LEDLRESWIPGSFGPFDTCADFELCVSALASIRQVAQPKQKHVGKMPVWQRLPRRCVRTSPAIAAFTVKWIPLACAFLVRNFDLVDPN
jgi:hypothetical protein